MVRYVLLAAVSALFLAGSVFAAPPPPIPPVPDANRTQTATIVSSTPSLLVNFAVYGDCSDLAVTINTTAAFYPSALWNCDSAGGLPLNTLPLPITDMRVNFTPPLTSGTVTIAGAWHPRNLTVPTAPGINRREFMQAFSTLAVSNRELTQATAALGAPIFTPTLFASPPPVGNVLANTGAFTTLSASGAVDLTGTLKANGGAVAGRPIIWGVDTGSGPYGLVPFLFTSTEDLAIGDTTHHFTMAVQGTKAASGTGNGSRTAFIAQQFGGNLATLGHFAVGAQFSAVATAGTGANGGTWVGANQLCSIPAGMTAATVSCWGAEVDVNMDSPGVGKVGLGVADLKANGSGSSYDTALMAYKSGAGTGFQNAFRVGLSAAAEWPLKVGGTIIQATAADVAPAIGIDFSGINQSFSTAAIKLREGNGASIIWGTSAVGGQVTSATTVNGGAVIFANSSLNLQQGGTNTFQVLSTGVRVVGTFSNSTVLLASNAVPTISSGFGTSPSVSANNGTWAFRINVGTGGTATSGVIGLPAATTGWNCKADDITTTNATAFLTKQTASSTTTATLGNFDAAGVAAAWAASDILAVQCMAL